MTARTTADAFWAFDPFAVVKLDDPRFADIEPLLPNEHYGVTANLRRFFRPSPQRPKHVHVGLVGHQGTGKTTLMRKAMRDLAADGIMHVPVNALQVVDTADFGFADVMLVIARAVIACLNEQSIALESEVVESVYRWFAEEIMSETHTKEILGSLQTEASAGFSFPLLAEFSSKVVAALKSNNDYRVEIRRRAERNYQDLTSRINVLLDGAHRAVAARKQQLCVVLDDLEKIPNRALVDAAVLRNADEFRKLRTHLVLFLSPEDQYAPGAVQAAQAFDAVFVPVLPVRFFREDQLDEVRPEAKRAIECLLDRRVVLESVFTNIDDCVVALGRLSGGHIRDLLRIARRAAELAEPDKISVAHIEKAARWLAGTRNTLLKPDDWKRAVEIHKTREIENREEDARLLNHSCVLNYDGDPWWDVHPIVRNDARFQRIVEST